MTGNSTIILGIEIPSTDPVFVGVIVALHIPLGLACVIAGAVGMLSEKGGWRPFDRRKGLLLVPIDVVCVGDVSVDGPLE